MGRVELALAADSPDAPACVIKRMHRGETWSSDMLSARFRREASIAARLSHRNIARTFGIDDVDGEPCIAQEFIEGLDLGRLMKQLRPRSLPGPVAVHVVSQVARALTHAHDFKGLGIVHRDVTPENIMISFDGDVKLIDFGIARSMMDATLTTGGIVPGRRDYIAPEAWAGGKPDARVDVFALSVVLWELLTGRRVDERRDAHPGERLPHPSTVSGWVPRALGDIVMRGLAVDPADRFQSAKQLRRALAPFAPPASEARAELLGILRSHCNVASYREVIAQDIADARLFLASQAPATKSGAHHRQGAVVAVLIAVAGAVAGVALALWGT
jgi:serine/threonine-protein kinase